MTILIEDTFTFDCPPEAIWPSIFDPAALMELIPGCGHIEQVSATEYRGEISVGAAAITGAYQTLVTILERRDPAFCRMAGEVSGPTGTISGEAAFSLKEVEDQTELSYEGKALITGALSTISPRFIESFARMMIRQGLSRLNRQARPTGQEEPHQQA